MTTDVIETTSGPARLKMSAHAILHANKMNPLAAHNPFMRIVATDVGQALALFGITQAEFERRALCYLQDHIKPDVNVQKHTRKPPAETLERQRAAARKVAERLANVIMLVDGVDIREWSIGQCLTAARRKGHEAYVLRVLGNDYKHLPDHGKRIGDVVSDGVLRSIVAQGRAHADEN